MSCFTSQITTTHNGVIVSMIFLFSHPEWLEVPEKKLPVAPSTAGKGTEVQPSEEVHSKSVHTTAVWLEL